MLSLCDASLPSTTLLNKYVNKNFVSCDDRCKKDKVDQVAITGDKIIVSMADGDQATE